MSEGERIAAAFQQLGGMGDIGNDNPETLYFLEEHAEEPGPRLDLLPMGVTMQMLDFAGAHSALTLECVSRLMQELRDKNDNVWSETLGARWRTEGSVLLELRPRATAEQLFHAFATKRMLQTNIDDGYGESLAMMFCEDVERTLQDIVPRYINHQVVPKELISLIDEYIPEPLDNSPDRLVFVLSLRCGSFLLRWDGTGAVCEAVLETYVDVESELATLHVIDMKTFKCVTICENLRAEYAGRDLVYFMGPDIMRHNLPQEFEDSSDLHNLEVVEGDATAEVCRMQLWLELRPHNNTYILDAQFSENNDSLDIPDWVTTVDQDDSDGGLAVRQLLVDVIEQS